jgi:hypothetical protein
MRKNPGGPAGSWCRELCGMGTRGDPGNHRFDDREIVTSSDEFGQP